MKGFTGIYLNPDESGVARVIVPTEEAHSSLVSMCGGPLTAVIFGNHILYHRADEKLYLTSEWFQFWDFKDGSYLLVAGPSILLGNNPDDGTLCDSDLDSEGVARMVTFVDKSEAFRIAETHDL